MILHEGFGDLEAIVRIVLSCHVILSKTNKLKISRTATELVLENVELLMFYKRQI